MTIATKTGGAIVQLKTPKSGANFHDRNTINRLAEEGHGVDEIAMATRIDPEVVKGFMPKKKAATSRKKTATKKTESVDDLTG